LNHSLENVWVKMYVSDVFAASITFSYAMMEEAVIIALFSPFVH